MNKTIKGNRKPNNSGKRHNSQKAAAMEGEASMNKVRQQTQSREFTIEEIRERAMDLLWERHLIGPAFIETSQLSGLVCVPELKLLELVQDGKAQAHSCTCGICVNLRDVAMWATAICERAEGGVQ